LLFFRLSTFKYACFRDSSRPKKTFWPMIVDSLLSFQFPHQADAGATCLLGLLTHIGQSGDCTPAYLWAQTSEAWVFDRWQDVNQAVCCYRANQLLDRNDWKPSERLLETLSGRWFTDILQIQWRCVTIDGARYVRVVCMGDSAAVSRCKENLDGASELFHTDTQTLDLQCNATGESFLLWGQQTSNSPGEWIELSIPHRLSYPIGADGVPQYVGVRALRWVDCVGETHFLRYTGLVPLDDQAIEIDETLESTEVTNAPE